MRDALIRDDALTAPSVGVWRPLVALGSPLVPGALMGSLLRDGRPLEVRVPRRAAGVVLELTPRGTWVAFDDALLRMGEGSLGGVAAGAAVAVAGGPAGGTAVLAETDGTVYLSADPSSPPFAPEGAAVTANQTLALVEVMKTFTPVRSPCAGTIVRVDVDDSGPVSEGQAMFWIRPTGAST